MVLLIFRGYIPYFCTGLLAFRKTQKTISLLKHWYEINTINDWPNQKSFQKSVYQSNANGRSLPMSLFPNGELFFEKMPLKYRSDVVIVHNNFLVGKEQKIQRFKHFNLWYTKSGNNKRINNPQ